MSTESVPESEATVGAPIIVFFSLFGLFWSLITCVTCALLGDDESRYEHTAQFGEMLETFEVDWGQVLDIIGILLDASQINSLAFLPAISWNVDFTLPGFPNLHVPDLVRSLSFLSLTSLDAMTTFWIALGIVFLILLVLRATLTGGDREWGDHDFLIFPDTLRCEAKNEYPTDGPLDRLHTLLYITLFLPLTYSLLPLLVCGTNGRLMADQSVQCKSPARIAGVVLFFPIYFFYMYSAYYDTMVKKCARHGENEPDAIDAKFFLIEFSSKVLLGALSVQLGYETGDDGKIPTMSIVFCVFIFLGFMTQLCLQPYGSALLQLLRLSMEALKLAIAIALLVGPETRTAVILVETGFVVAAVCASVSLALFVLSWYRAGVKAWHKRKEQDANPTTSTSVEAQGSVNPQSNTSSSETPQPDGSANEKEMASPPSSIEPTSSGVEEAGAAAEPDLEDISLNVPSVTSREIDLIVQPTSIEPTSTGNEEAAAAAAPDLQALNINSTSTNLETDLIVQPKSIEPTITGNEEAAGGAVPDLEAPSLSSSSTNHEISPYGNPGPIHSVNQVDNTGSSSQILTDHNVLIFLCLCLDINNTWYQELEYLRVLLTLLIKYELRPGPGAAAEPITDRIGQAWSPSAKPNPGLLSGGQTESAPVTCSGQGPESDDGDVQLSGELDSNLNSRQFSVCRSDFSASHVFLLRQCTVLP
eukprot:g75622.t1